MLSFEDATAAAGLLEPLDCMKGHAALFGDLDRDGWPELLFGTFGDRPAAEYLCPDGPRPNRLLRNIGGAFEVASEPSVEVLGRASGGVWADFDGDGDLDLLVTHNSKQAGDDVGQRSTMLFRNDDGALADVSAQSGLARVGLAARNSVVLDYDGDGDIDVFVVGDMFGEHASVLFRNDGGLVFTDQTSAAGLGGELRGLAAAAGDVDDDGWPDLFVGHEDALFRNDSGTFSRVQALDATFAWPEFGGEDWRAGVAFGDVDRDGRLDLLVGHHYDSAWRSPVALRLFRNTTTAGGDPQFEEVTGDSGLAPIAAKSPHVEIQDFDNDGWPDVYASVHVEVDGRIEPIVFVNQRDPSTPRFAANGLTVANDGVVNVGYGAAGPTVDFDRDGRVDLLITEWDSARNSVLYRNTSAAGNYVEVVVGADAGSNPMGIGARVFAYEPGSLGVDSALIGSVEIGAGYGYSSGQEAVARLGIADRDAVDIRVVLPASAGTQQRSNVAANQRISVP